MNSSGPKAMNVHNKLAGNLSTRNMGHAKSSLLNLKKRQAASRSPTAAIPSSIYSTLNTKSKKDIGHPYKVVNIELGRKAPISITQALGYNTAQAQSEASLKLNSSSLAAGHAAATQRQVTIDLVSKSKDNEEWQLINHSDKPSVR